MTRVGVVGCDLMRVRIAEFCARAELDIVGVESSDKATRAGLARIAASLERARDRERSRTPPLSSAA